MTPGPSTMSGQPKGNIEDPEDWVSRLLELDAGQALPLDDLVGGLCKSTRSLDTYFDRRPVVHGSSAYGVQLDSDFLNSEVTSEQSCAR